MEILKVKWKRLKGRNAIMGKEDLIGEKARKI